MPKPAAPMVKPVFVNPLSYTNTMARPAGKLKPSAGADAQTFVFVVGAASHVPSLFVSKPNPYVVTVALVHPALTFERTHAFGTLESAVLNGTRLTTDSGPVQSAGFRQICNPVGPDPNVSLPLPPGEKETVRDDGFNTVVREICAAGKRVWPTEASAPTSARAAAACPPTTPEHDINPCTPPAKVVTRTSSAPAFNGPGGTIMTW